MKWKLIPLLLVLAVPLPAQQVLNLRDADIRAFIQDVARVTGRTRSQTVTVAVTKA